MRGTADAATDAPRRGAVGAVLDAGPWPLLAWALPAVAALLASMAVNDVAYLVRAGDVMRETGAILRHDVFTFTMAGAPWLNQQWGSELVFSIAHGVVGWRGLVIVRALLVAAVVGATYVRTRRAGADRALGASLTLGAFAVAAVVPGTVSLRAQLLGAGLFVVTAWLLDDREERPTRLMLLIPVAVVWANVHGSFPLLTLLVLLAFVDDAVRRRPGVWRTGAVGLASAVAFLVNPWGPDVVAYVADVSTSPVVRDAVDEWRPLWERWPGIAVFLAAAAGVVAVLWSRAARRPRPGEALGLVAFTVLALWSSRNLLWWVLYVPPVTAAVASGVRVGGRIPRRVTAVVSAALVLLLGLGVARVLGAGEATDLLTEAPAGVAEALTRPTGGRDRVFVDARWSSWLEHAVPDVRVFADARVELFDEEIWADYFAIVGADPDPTPLLDRWGAEVVVVSRADQPDLLVALSGDPGWRLGYEDATAAIFTRTT